MTERKRVIGWINDIETEKNTPELLYKDLHLWPVLKWYLFSNYFKNKSSGAPKKKGNINKNKLRLQNIFKAVLGGLLFFKLKLIGTRQIEVLFASASTYRVYFQNKFINRFFQPLAENLEKKKMKFLFADYRVKNHTDYPFKAQHFNIRLLFAFISFRNKGRRIRQDAMLEEIIDRYNNVFDLNVNSSLFYKEVAKIFDWAEAYELLLQKAKPKLVFLICYYDNQMFGLNLAAFRQGIKTVDLQHGGQGNLNVNYSGFDKFPESGYSCLPGYFWVWDETSFNSLRKKLGDSNKHKVILGGNPWISYLHKRSRTKNNSGLPAKNIILFSLQPITPLIPRIVYEAIDKTPENYIWWFRMHPRMTINDITEIKEFIKKENLTERVYTEEPTELPLPLVLERTTVHISKYSGCILEASLMGVPNIVIDPIGKETFNDIIDNKFNFYLDSGNIWDLIKSIENKDSRTPLDFVPPLEQLLKDVGLRKR